MTPRRALIIGGGISGLATANLLAQDGWRVTVLERRDQLGGRAGVLTVDGFAFDTGPSWYLMTEVFERYYSLLGRSVSNDLDLVRLDPAYRVFSEHQPAINIHSNIDQAAATFEALEPGAGQKLRTYIARAEKLYQVSLRQFLYTNFDRPGALLNADVLRSAPHLPRHPNLDKYVSGQFKHPLLRQILEYPSVFLGTSPYKAPSIYSLMSYLDFQQGVYYPRGGLYEIIKSFVKIGQDLGVEHRLNADVTAINANGGRVTGVTLKTGETIAADIVISGADLHHTEQNLLAPEHRSQADKFWSKAEPGPSALLLYLGVKGDLPQLAHHNLIFTADWQTNFGDVFGGKRWPHPASIYVSMPSKTDPTVAPAGHQNLFVLVPLPAAVMPSAQDEALHISQYLDQLAVAIGAPDLKDRIVVQRSFGPAQFAAEFNSWQGGALGLGHTWGQSAIFRPGVRSKKLSNLFYVGANVRPGIGLPMCLISAEVVYTAIKEMS